MEYRPFVLGRTSGTTQLGNPIQLETFHKFPFNGVAQHYKYIHGVCKGLAIKNYVASLLTLGDSNSVNSFIPVNFNLGSPCWHFDA